MKPSRFAAVAIISSLLIAWAGGTATAQQSAPPRWAPAAQASVHPGVQTVTGGGQCTANFVFYDADDIYIGQAAHCSGTEGSDQLNGCESGVLPVGTPVQVSGASRPGTIVYNSWVTMQEEGERDRSTCLGNDFALVRIDPADHASINPSVPFWGGPTGIDPSSSFGERVYAYGNSGLRAGIALLAPKVGVATGPELDGWNHGVATVTPGIPGDSGSAYLGSDGGALGVLSTIEIFPLIGTNNVSDLARALQYMSTHTDFDVRLAEGTEAFSGLL